MKTELDIKTQLDFVLKQLIQSSHHGMIQIVGEVLPINDEQAKGYINALRWVLE